MQKKNFRIPKKLYNFFIIFFAFLLFGIIQPIVLGFENIFQAIIASKEFWYISILIYLLYNKKRLDNLLLIKFIQFIGIYLAIMYIIYYLFKIGPIFYVEENHVRGFFPTYISLALFLYYVDFQDNKIKLFKFLFIFILSFIGLILAGHFSLLIGTFLTLSILFIFFKKNKFRLFNTIFKTFFFSVLLFLIFLLNSNFRNIISSTIEGVFSGTDTALVARETYNGFRWEAINERPLIGYGFIHKDAPISKNFDTMDDNLFAERFGVIDSGYVDLLIKFGYIGMICYLLLWASAIAPIFFRPSKYQLLQIGMAFYLLQYFVVNYTWSVLSYAHGLIPAFIAMFLIYYPHKKSKIRLQLKKRMTE